MWCMGSGLPVAAQQQTVGLFLNDSLAYNGYTLFSPNQNVYLIDNCGFLVKQWVCNRPPGLSVYLLENGDLLRPGRVANPFAAGGVGGQIERYSWEGELLWSYRYADELHQQHHDIQPLPNGNVLILAWEVKTRGRSHSSGP